jgi:hypothetical protein
MIRPTMAITAGLIFTAASIVPVPASADALSSMFGVYAYPNKGQSQTQQTNDESICYKSARDKTAVDPANLPVATGAPATAKQAAQFEVRRVGPPAARLLAMPAKARRSAR